MCSISAHAQSMKNIAWSEKREIFIHLRLRVCYEISQEACHYLEMCSDIVMDATKPWVQAWHMSECTLTTRITDQRYLH